MSQPSVESHLFIGPLCRYFAASAAEAAQRVAAIEVWRDQLTAALGSRAAIALDWPEEPSDEPGHVELGPLGLDPLRLLAVYADRTELELPDTTPQPLTLDDAFARAAAANFAQSRYGHLLAASIWLPREFDFTFVCPRPDGDDATFGSLQALDDQLGFLNARTFALSLDDRDGAAPIDRGRFIDDAQTALRICVHAVRAALARGLPLVAIT